MIVAFAVWVWAATRPTTPVKLAVLPFANLTGNPDREYLADGLTEEATVTLALRPPAAKARGPRRPIDSDFPPIEVRGRRARPPNGRYARIPNGRYVPSTALAYVYAGLGEHARAFEWLEKAHAARDVHLVFLPVDPRWDEYRNDHRFVALVARCGFKRDTTLEFSTEPRFGPAPVGHQVPTSETSGSQAPSSV